MKNQVNIIQCTCKCQLQKIKISNQLKIFLNLYRIINSIIIYLIRRKNLILNQYDRIALLLVISLKKHILFYQNILSIQNLTKKNIFIVLSDCFLPKDLTTKPADCPRNDDKPSKDGLRQPEFQNKVLFIKMTRMLGIEDKPSLRVVWTGLAGAIASLLTQPLEVIKTNRINTPSMVYWDLHQKIVSNGWKTYMRGSSIAVIRQAYGFTIYTQLLSKLQNRIFNKFPALNKFYNYSLSSVIAKLTAMVFQAPLTLLKTRLQCVSSLSLIEQIKKLTINPLQQMKKGLGSSIARQALYTLFHYNTYRFLKDDIFASKLNSNATFIPAFVAGIVSISVSQPFQVIRNRISLKKNHITFFRIVQKIWMQSGTKGFFVGFIPRLLRKPINSGICWTILQSTRSIE